MRRDQLKAVYISEYGDVDKLIYGDRPDPSPGQGEVVLRVRASALNHLDLGLRSGQGRTPGDLPRILGCDMAGEIADDLRELLPVGQVPFVTRFGPVIGTYVGPGAVGIGLLRAQDAG